MKYSERYMNSPINEESTSNIIDKILQNNGISPPRMSEDSAEVLESMMTEIQQKNKPNQLTKIVSFANTFKTQR